MRIWPLVASTLVIGAALAAWGRESNFFAATSDGYITGLGPIQERIEYDNRGANISRMPIMIPADYGRLIHVTPVNGSFALWFQGDDGAIRNINVSQDKLLLITRDGTVKRSSNP